MKRFLLGLIMVSGFALAAAPMAYAATSPTYICGTATANHNYAFLVTGTEPVTATTTAATYPLNYIAGVGVLKFGPYSATVGGPGVPGCTIISGEMIYLDNDYQTFQGGPVDCSSISSLDGVPCFDGGNHVLEGVVGPGPNGSATVAFAMDFPFVLGATETPLPFSFTVVRRCRRCDSDRKQQYSSRRHRRRGNERQPAVYRLRSRYRMRTEFTDASARTGAELHRTAAVNQRSAEPGSDGRWRSAVYR